MVASGNIERKHRLTHGFWQYLMLQLSFMSYTECHIKKTFHAHISLNNKVTCLIIWLVVQTERGLTVS